MDQNNLKQISIKLEYGNIYNKAEKFDELYCNTRNDCPADNTEGYRGELKKIVFYCTEHVIRVNHVEMSTILRIPMEREGNVITLVPRIIILAIPFVLYTLYKFTAYRSWVNTRILTKKEIWNNFSKKTQLKMPIEHELNI
ncbi:PIR Superfamily Protein [Plasmodium ovale wallikeri]|uniref:PIR Superfamily Protein n=1 Tax=Plasmodium ovale wallikeri TaxID=864142 RepID=A0A1A9AGT7_PLAOA|nr:PIR Superfamily Protein [Plasmodium ovale wallikeri]SBT56463.1 PIR Superfamily Protein [Plasmodium ovale wallikeri]